MRKSLSSFNRPQKYDALTVVKSDGPRPHWTFFLLSFSFYVRCFVPRRESSSSWSEIIGKRGKTKQKILSTGLKSAEKLHINFSNVQHPPLLLSLSLFTIIHSTHKSFYDYYYMCCAAGAARLQDFSVLNYYKSSCVYGWAEESQATVKTIGRSSTERVDSLCELQWRPLK